MSNKEKGCSVLNVLDIGANCVVALCAIAAVLWGWFSFRQDLADRARPYIDFRPWDGTWSLFQQPLNDPNLCILEFKFELANASSVPAKDIRLSTVQARTGLQFESNPVSEKEVSTFMKVRVPEDRLNYKGENWKVHLSPQTRPPIVSLRLEMPKSLYRKYMGAELPNDMLVVYIYTEVSYTSIAGKSSMMKYLWKASITKKASKSSGNRDQKSVSGGEESEPSPSSNAQLGSNVEWQLVWSDISTN